MFSAVEAGLKIDFSLMMLAEIHERVFKTSTAYPILRLIFLICKDTRVTIRHWDTLKPLTRTLAIRIIKDEDNMVAPHKRPGENMEDTVG